APHLLRRVDDRVAADARIAALRRIERRQDPHRRRVAAPVGADEAEALAALDAERHVVDGTDAVEVADQAVELEHRVAHGCPPGHPTSRGKLRPPTKAGTPESQKGDRSSTAMYDPSG